MKKIVTMASVATLLVAGLVIAGVAMAQPGDDRPGRGGGYWGCPYYPGGPAADTLNLTTDQQKKLTDLQEKYAEKNDDITDQIIAKERELRKLYWAETPDLKSIDKIEDQIKVLMEKRFALKREFRNSARSILTAEQLKANPYAFMVGPGFGRGFGPGMMGPGGGMGRGWDDDDARGGRGWWKCPR